MEKNGKGLVLVNFPKWPKYINSISIAHFVKNFNLVKNMWVIRNFQLTRVVKTIKNLGSNSFLDNISLILYLTDIKPGLKKSGFKTTLHRVVEKQKLKNMEVFLMSLQAVGALWFHFKSYRPIKFTLLCLAGEFTWCKYGMTQ